MCQLSTQHIPFDQYNNFKHFHETIIAELLRRRHLLRNSTLIPLHFESSVFNVQSSKVQPENFLKFPVNFFQEQMNSC